MGRISYRWPSHQSAGSIAPSLRAAARCRSATVLGRSNSQPVSSLISPGHLNSKKTILCRSRTSAFDAIQLLLALTFLHPPLATAAPTFAPGVSQGTVAFPELTEASGLIASHNNRDVLWTHNDAGDTPRIFAIDTQGRKLGIYNLTAATHV